MKLREKKRGFTLIEVTLAIVIGIILVACATLIYNQARNSAGNSRANAKVVALQSVVEEFAAMNGGLYPDRIPYVQGMWERRRPDDFNKSPWGGQVGPFFAGSTVDGVVTVDGNIALDDNGIAFGLTDAAGPSNKDYSTITGGAGATESTQANAQLSGGLVYHYNGAGEIWFARDLRTNQQVKVRSMAVFICDQQGRYPNFVVGGRMQ